MVLGGALGPWRLSLRRQGFQVYPSAVRSCSAEEPSGHPLPPASGTSELPAARRHCCCRCPCATWYVCRGKPLHAGTALWDTATLGKHRCSEVNTESAPVPCSDSVAAGFQCHRPSEILRSPCFRWFSSCGLFPIHAAKLPKKA